MILRIILGIILCAVVIDVIFTITVIIPIWKVISKTKCIYSVFDEVFKIYQKKGKFSQTQLEKIKIGKVRIEFYNLEEACDKLERYVDETLEECAKDEWFNISPKWERSLEKLLEIKSRIDWLRKKL